MVPNFMQIVVRAEGRFEIPIGKQFLASRELNCRNTWNIAKYRTLIKQL